MLGRGIRSVVLGGRSAVALLVVASTIGSLGEARADEPPSEPRESCDAAFEAAELRLRPSEGRLLDARAALLACARPSCKSWMVDDCSKRLVEVEGRIPSVVFSAEDARGAFLEDVRVLEGARELLGHLDGRAVEMDPGPHELVAERGRARVPLSVVVIEGKKAQQVVFAFRDIFGGSIAPPPREVPAPRHPWSRPLAAAMLGGSVVATGIGVGLVVVAVDKKDEAHCDAANLCDDAGSLESARHAARAATVSFVVGGALALGAAFTFLVFGRTRVQAAASFNHVRIAITW